MTVQPTKLYLIDPKTLGIEWSDGQRRVYDVAELRSNCPCAMCADLRRQRGDGEPPSDTPTPPVSITQMGPVGNYAYKIHFSDGHSTGIYTLELLRELGHESAGTGEV